MTPYRIDLLDSTGARVGDGPLTTVLTLEDTARLDAVGSAQFTLPAEDPRAIYINAGAQFDIYDLVDGYIGRFYYRNKTIDAKATGGARLVVTCHNQLIELARTSVLFRRTYAAQDVDVVIQDLVEMVSGWTEVTDSGIGSTSVMYEGESVLLAVDTLRDRWNKHFRLGEASVLEFGAFGDSSGVTLTTVSGQVQSEQPDTTLAIVDSIRLVDESDEIFNYLIPLGAGQGTSQLTLQQATLGSYTTETGTNEDGSSYYFIQDAASVATYGRRDKILSFPSIRPITNSVANILNASNALKLAAEAYIARHLIPRVTYAVNVRGLKQEIQVGDTVRLQYRGVVDGYSFIDVDDNFYVMDVTRKRDVNGNRSATLNIASLAERRTSDTDVVLDVISDLRALKISVPITLAYSPVGPYTKRIDETHPAEFTVRIGSEVTFLNYAILRFRNSPLKSSVATVASGGSSSPTSGASSDNTTSNGGAQTSSGGSSHTHTTPAHAHTVTQPTHTHTIEVRDVAGLEGTPVYFNETSHYFNSTLTSGTDTATSSAGGNDTLTSNTDGSSTSGANTSHTHDVSNHTHNMPHTHGVTIAAHTHSLTYGLFEDTVYPSVISIAIDGVDRTVELGGEWDIAGNGVEVELDITEYLIDAIGGLRQNHRIEFSCLSPSQGEIECEVDMLASIQSIAVA